MAARGTKINIAYRVTFADEGTRHMLEADRKMRTSVAQTSKLLKEQSTAATRAASGEKHLADATSQAAATAARAARAAAQAASAYAKQAAGVQHAGTATVTAGREMSRAGSQVGSGWQRGAREATSAARSIESAGNRSSRASKRHAEEVIAANKLLGGSWRSTARSAVTAGAGFAAAYVGIAKARTAIESAVQLAKTTKLLASNTGLSTQEASKWAAVSQTMGIQSNQLGMAFSRLSKATITQAEHTGKTKTAFDQLGISQDFAKRHGNDMSLVMETVVDRLGKMHGGAQKTALEMQLFGRGWQTLNPLIRGGSKAMQENLDMAKRYGLVLTQNGTTKLLDLAKAEREHKMAMLGLQVTFAEKLAPSLIHFEQLLGNVIVDIQHGNWTDFSKQIGKMSEQFAGIAQHVIPVMVTSMANAAPQMIGAIVSGIAHSSPVGAAVLSALLLRKLGLLSVVGSVARIAGGKLAATLGLEAAAKMILPPSFKAKLVRQAEVAGAEAGVAGGSAEAAGMQRGAMGGGIAGGLGRGGVQKAPFRVPLGSQGAGGGLGLSGFAKVGSWALIATMFWQAAQKPLQDEGRKIGGQLGNRLAGIGKSQLPVLNILMHPIANLKASLDAIKRAGEGVGAAFRGVGKGASAGFHAAESAAKSVGNWLGIVKRDADSSSAGYRNAVGGMVRGLNRLVKEHQISAAEARRWTTALRASSIVSGTVDQRARKLSGSVSGLRELLGHLQKGTASYNRVAGEMKRRQEALFGPTLALQDRADKLRDRLKHLHKGTADYNAVADALKRTQGKLNDAMAGLAGPAKKGAEGLRAVGRVAGPVKTSLHAAGDQAGYLGSRFRDLKASGDIAASGISHANQLLSDWNRNARNTPKSVSLGHPATVAGTHGAMGGHVTSAGIYAALGAMVPRGTDTVAAMLTPGEFVVRQPAVQQIGLPAMRQINRGVLPGQSTRAGSVQLDTRQAQASAKQLAGVAQRTGRDLTSQLGRPVKTLQTDATKSFKKLRDEGSKQLVELPKIAKKQGDLYHDTTVNRLKDTQRDGLKHIDKLHDGLDLSMKDSNKRLQREIDKSHDVVQSGWRSIAKVVDNQSDKARSSSTSNFRSLAKSADNLSDKARSATTSHMRAAASAVQNQTGKARSTLSSNYSSMAKTASSRAGSIENTTRSHMSGAAGAVRNRSGQMQRNLRSSLGSMDSTSREGFTYVGTAADKALSTFGAKPVHLSLQAPKLKARGGFLDGVGLMDNVPVWAAPDEFFATRHQQEPIQTALAFSAMHGVQPYPSLDAVASNITTPHHMARGGHIPRFAKGGAVGNFGAMVAKANEISSHNYSYSWGGGHNSSFSPPYDCSGGVSAVLHAGGVLSSPMVAQSFMNWGQPGPGKVTIHAGPGHVMMELGGRGWGTSHLRPGGGAGWLPIHNTSITPATRHIGASGSANIKMPKVLGPDGSLKRGSIGAIKKVHDAAQKYVDSKMPTGSSVMGFGSGAWQDELRHIAKSRGWNANDWFALVQGESGGNPGARNPSSGAFGLGQFLGGTLATYASRGATSSDPVKQIDAMGAYISDRYGSPSNAYHTWLGRSPHWYARGGRIARNARAIPRRARGGFGRWRPRKMANGGYVSGGAGVPSSWYSPGFLGGGAQPHRAGDIRWQDLLGHMSSDPSRVGAPLDYARFFTELLGTLTKYVGGRPQYRTYTAYRHIPHAYGQGYPGGMAMDQAGGGGAAGDRGGEDIDIPYRPVPSAATEKLVAQRIIKTIRRQIERFTGKELAGALRDTQSELDVLTAQASNRLKTIHTALGDVRVAVSGLGGQQFKTNAGAIKTAMSALESEANHRARDLFKVFVTPAGTPRSARRWDPKKLQAAVGGVGDLSEFIDHQMLTALQHGALPKALQSARQAASKAQSHLNDVQKHYNQVATDLKTATATETAARGRKHAGMTADAARRVQREIDDAHRRVTELHDQLYGKQGSGGLRAELATAKGDKRLKLVKMIRGIQGLIDDAVAREITAGFQDTSNQIDSLGNQLDELGRARRRIDFVPAGMKGATGPLAKLTDASARWATDSAAALTEQATAQRQQLKAMGDQGTGLMHDLIIQMRQAAKQHQPDLVAQIKAKIGELAVTINETAASMVENIRAAAEKAAQDVVDLAQFGVSGYMTSGGQITGQAGLTHLELQERLAGTFDTSGAERSSYITSTIVPALEAEITALQSQETVALQQGDPVLARQIAGEIASVTNDRDQAKIDALDQIAANTQNPQNFTGPTAFEFQGERMTDLASLGVGA